MKQTFLKLGSRIDAMNLRERVAVFAAAAAVVLFLVYSMLLNPLYSKQAALQTQIGQQRNNIAGIDQEITQKMQDYAQDPDAVPRARLQAVNAESVQLANQLRAVQKDLVAPDKIVPLLEAILKANGRLRLVSMKTLPVSGLNEGAGLVATPAVAPAAAATVGPGAAPVIKPAALLYRHGVQLAVQGSYLDMVDYMSALEAMPNRLFWGKAVLEAGQYPQATLTLTLYTLGLERKWIEL